MFRKSLDSVPKSVLTKFLNELSVIRLRKNIAYFDKSNSILEVGLYYAKILPVRVYHPVAFIYVGIKASPSGVTDLRCNP